MKGCRVSSEWSYRGMRSLILENELLKASILVDFGSKIFEFIHKPTDRDFLYHHPRVELRAPVYGVNADNWWPGGIDEAIPTGHVSKYKGEEYPYIGEVWSLPWQFDILSREKDEVIVHLWRPTVIAPLLVEKWITLRNGEAMLHFRHKITNLGLSDFKFLWGIHPALDIGPSSRIDIPAVDVLIEESIPDDRLGSRNTAYKWPYAVNREGRKVDMRAVQPEESRTCDFHFATKLTDGWLAVTDRTAKEGFGLVFPKEVFNTIWLWLVYGGWRDVYCAAVEAWTGYPAKLNEAVERGTCSTLGPKRSLECETLMLAYTGFSAVEGITRTGEVTGPR
jgi:hypothetical protein